LTRNVGAIPTDPGSAAVFLQTKAPSGLSSAKGAFRGHGVPSGADRGQRAVLPRHGVARGWPHRSLHLPEIHAIDGIVVVVIEAGVDFELQENRLLWVG